MLRADGEWRWINDRGTPFFDESGAFAGYIGSCMDVTDKVEGLAYKEISQKDGLTGILSRQYLLNQLQRFFDIARTNGLQLTIALMDIDKFKKINDRFGHLIGDSALKLFASVVKDKIRSEDLFGRYGGDEFLIVFRNTTANTAHEVIARIDDSLKTVVLKAGQDEIALTMSAGVASLSAETAFDELINLADQRMYLQKRDKKLVADVD